MPNWNERFIDLAGYISSWSKDRSTKVGAVIVSTTNRILSTGYNGFPSKCNESDESRHLRPAKYLYTEHAERNAIYNAAREGVQTLGATMYLQWFPCADCARAIIQSGIAAIVCTVPDFNDERWGPSFKAASEMLYEAGVNVTFY